MTEKTQSTLKKIFIKCRFFFFERSLDVYHSLLLLSLPPPPPPLPPPFYSALANFRATSSLLLGFRDNLVYMR